MWLSMEGKVYYMNEVMSTYRVAALGSYSVKVINGIIKASQHSLQNYLWFLKILNMVPERYKQYVKLMIQC